MALVGCGGSIDSDPNGNGGSAGNAGAGAVGGSGASAGVGGSGAASGSGGGAGDGGNAGFGGSAGGSGAGGAPYCCTWDGDCPQWYGDGDGDGPGDEPPAQSTECVNGVCKEIQPYPQCWDNDDCGYSGSCLGASVCPCGADCISPDVPGWCAQPPACCTTDWDCGDFMYIPCVNGVCKQTVPGACWTNAECQSGQQCVGANVCPCMALCATIDTPGKCM